jgi:hypothetical protein
MFFDHLTPNRQIVPTKHAFIEFQIKTIAIFELRQDKVAQKLQG